MPDMVKMKLTFWHHDKKPGDTIEVAREDVRSWEGFAVPLDDPDKAESASSDRGGDDKAPVSSKTVDAPAASRTSKS